MQHIGKQINKQGEIGLKQTNNVHPLKKAYRKTRQDNTYLVVYTGRSLKHRHEDSEVRRQCKWPCWPSRAIENHPVPQQKITKHTRKKRVIQTNKFKNANVAKNKKEIVLHI